MKLLLFTAQPYTVVCVWPKSDLLTSTKEKICGAVFTIVECQILLACVSMRAGSV